MFKEFQVVLVASSKGNGRQQHCIPPRVEAIRSNKGSKQTAALNLPHV